MWARTGQNGRARILRGSLALWREIKGWPYRLFLNTLIFIADVCCVSPFPRKCTLPLPWFPGPRHLDATTKGMPGGAHVTPTHLCMRCRCLVLPH